jgi:hypothetical protein
MNAARSILKSVAVAKNTTRLFFHIVVCTNDIRFDHTKKPSGWYHLTSDTTIFSVVQK